ncbi:MAG: fructosamine kinase family protein [Planctomycetes bacterium]|nr:fructosamine kinase family protein [Planctomycetota bacterium]
MVFDKSVVSTEVATRLLRKILSRPFAVTHIRRLHGGMVNSVLELSTDAEPERVVCKLNARAGLDAFRWEHDVLQWYRDNTEFPVPEPYGCDLSGKLFRGSCLMMERLPGVNLAEAPLSPAARLLVERQLARIIARLHRHKRSTYGSALEPAQQGERRWLRRFRPRIQKEFSAAAGRLTAEARRIISRLIENLETWLPEFGEPTLVHGDLWATNIIVDPAAPRVTGFVDGGAEYADVEYELAYLLVFHTVGGAFFDEYRKLQPIRDGFDVRCRVYWLHTMLLHVRAFGDAHYVRACEGLARELDHLRPLSS